MHVQVVNALIVRVRKNWRHYTEITIALDEQGDFENLEGKLEKAPVFIGGIIYDDK